ncbi:glycoside hydrolase family 19 protein [Pedobacter africanus]|uniref:Chitinase class I n=1 Tax=Pedobacter africanus TaxID=151894 RepID=A0A1W1ZAZ4_9SPHI|nr:glycoside hydrolase family 19 protein [Pedobacter africanus]SMC45584.1 Chitinase class I [Pedobacter africanus]
MNSKAFYDNIRANIFAGSISPKQFEGIEAIIKEYNRLCVNDLRKLAYILGTVFHETDKTMQPIEEYTKGGGLPYGKKFKMGGGPGKRVPYTIPDKLYYGRGHVQLTWYENYQAMGKLLGVDLLNKPELMLTMDVSVKVLFEGMLKGQSNFGDFTGKSLEDYFTPNRSDWYNARRIVNGTDAAQKIADIAQKFYKALIIV